MTCALLDSLVIKVQEHAYPAMLPVLHVLLAPSKTVEAATMGITFTTNPVLMINVHPVIISKVPLIICARNAILLVLNVMGLRLVNAYHV